MPIQCNEALSNSCPNGYTCTFNALINGHVCCGASDQGVCPEEEKAFISTADMSPRECIVNVDASCPANYLCRFNMQRNKYYCCTSIAGRTLTHPSPPAVLWDEVTSVRKATHARAIYRMPRKVFAAPATQFVPTTPSSSWMSSRSCLGLVQWARSSAARVVTVADGCPPGNFVFINSDGETATCDPFNPENAPCPGGSTCQWSTANQRYQCCGSNPAPQSVRVNDGCPNAQIAYRDKRTKVRVCTAGSSTCPPGYFCQFSSLNRQFQCCGVSGEQCSAEEVSIDGKCLPRSAPGQECQHSEQCTGGSICHDGSCLCPASTQPLGGFCQTETKCAPEQIKSGNVCYNRVELGKPCVVSEQCPDREFQTLEITGKA
nr:Nematode-specific EB region domain containing protein [Haemonchus contortus]